MHLVGVHWWRWGLVGFVCSRTEVMEWSYTHMTFRSGDDGVVFGHVGTRVMVAWWRFKEKVVWERKMKGGKDILEILEVYQARHALNNSLFFCYPFMNLCFCLGWPRTIRRELLYATLFIFNTLQYLQFFLLKIPRKLIFTCPHLRPLLGWHTMQWHHPRTQRTSASIKEINVYKIENWIKMVNFQRVGI